MNESIKTLLSIDPGASSPSGWAVLTIGPAPKLLAVGQVKLSADTATDTLFNIKNILQELGCAIPLKAVIESSYLDKNVKTAIVLGRAYGRWEEACHANGMTVAEAQANQWQSQELSRRRTTKRAARKAMSIAKAAGIWGGNTWTEHEADAALMGRWYAIRTCYVRSV